jgi:hypothetical protein
VTYPFAQDFTYHFFPLVNEDAATVAANVQSQTPAIYVFLNRPDRTSASNGTGSLQTISTWTWGATYDGAWDVPVSAVADPNPTSEQRQWLFWICFNFVLKLGGTTQCVIREMPMERVTGQGNTVTTDQNDLRAIWPQVDAYASEPQRKAYITQSTEEVRAYLRAAGWEWSRINRLDRLNMVVAYKALAIICLGQSQAPNDKFYAKYVEYRDTYKEMRDSLRFEYDANGLGATDTTQTQGGTLFVIR